MTGTLREADSLEAMLPALLDGALAALDTDSGTLSFYDLRSDELVHAVSRGWMTQTGKTPQRPRSGIAGYVYRTGQPYVFEDLSTDPMSRPDVKASMPPGRSGACIPLRTQEATAGVMFVSFLQPRVMSEEEVRLLCAMGDMAGIALHRTLLFEEATRRLSQLHSLRAVDIAITGSPDLGATLEVLLDEVEKHQKADGVAVYLADPGQKRMLFAASRGVSTPPPAGTAITILGSTLKKAIREQATQLLTCNDGEQKSNCLLCTENHSYKHCLSVPLLSKDEVVGLLVLFTESSFPEDPEWHEFLVTLAGQGAIAIESARLFTSLQKSRAELLDAYDSTIEGWAHALDLRDSETEGHSRRVTDLTVALARHLAVPDQKLANMKRGAMLHDVGKMAIPDSILHKPGPLDEAEWEIMRQHPVYARQMLAGIDYLQPALAIPYGHHEKWDGTGYPLGQKGEEIPLEARIFAVVDVYDALCSQRPYRPAWSESEALSYISSQAGVHFDPAVVEGFLELVGTRDGALDA
jgi:HD-GYP domain-containing protein (c-di-GMP phosphodiesterase class II)